MASILSQLFLRLRDFCCRENGKCRTFLHCFKMFDSENDRYCCLLLFVGCWWLVVVVVCCWLVVVGYLLLLVLVFCFCWLFVGGWCLLLLCHRRRPPIFVTLGGQLSRCCRHLQSTNHRSVQFLQHPLCPHTF